MSVSLKLSYDIEFVSTENCARMDLFIDSDDDLVGLSYFDTIKLLQGSTAEDISTGDTYMMKSDGTWVLQPKSNQLDLTGYYTSAEVDNLIQKMPQVISRTVTTITASDTLADTGVSYTIPASGYVRITATAQYKDSGSNPQEIVIRTDSSVFAHESFTTGDNQYGLSASCIVGGIGAATLKIFSRFRLSGGGAYIVLTVETIPSV